MTEEQKNNPPSGPVVESDYTDIGRRRRIRRGGPPGIFLGLLILGLGLIFFLDQQGIFPAGVAFHFFWPGILIFFGISSIVCARHSHSVFWGAVLVAVGGILIANELGFFYFHIGSLWPLILIAFGVWLLLNASGHIRPRPPNSSQWPSDRDRQHWAEWGEKFRSRTNAPGAASFQETPFSSSTFTAPAASAPFVDESDAEFSHSVIFSGFKRRVTSQHFKYAKVSVVLGGFHIDLTRAGMDDSAVIHVDAVFGGGEIRIPANWKVVLEGGAVGGAFVDETDYHAPEPSAPAKRLYMRGAVVFGGVVIKN